LPNLKANSFVGTSKNALLFQIWTAMIVDLAAKVAESPLQGEVVLIQSGFHAAPQPVHPTASALGKNDPFVLG
jgi:hypothetical protein